MALLKDIWVKLFKNKKKRQPKLNNFYKSDKSLARKGDNISKRVHKNMQALGPIIFALFFAPTVVVVSSIMSQAAFLIASNIFLSLGFLVSITYGIYEKFTNQRKLAAVLELVFSLAIIAGLFFLAFYFTPFIGGWSFLGTLSFINLFASSINIFMLIRVLLLPPILSSLQAFLVKCGFEKAKIELEYSRDIRAVGEDNTSEDFCANILLIKYPESCRRFDDNWKKEAIKPFNHAKNVIRDYENKYQSSLLGNVIRSSDIANRRSNYMNMVERGDTDSIFAFFRRKLIDKSSEVRKLTVAAGSVSEDLRLHSNACKYFVKHDAKDMGFTFEEYQGVLRLKIKVLITEMLNILQAYPLHMALDHLNKTLKELTEDQRRYLARNICVESQVGLYAENGDTNFLGEKIVREEVDEEQLYVFRC